MYIILGALYVAAIAVAFVMVLETDRAPETDRVNHVIAVAALTQAVATCAIAYLAYQTLCLTRQSTQVKGTLVMLATLDKVTESQMAGQIRIINRARISQNILGVTASQGHEGASIAIVGYQPPFKIEAGGKIEAEYTIGQSGLRLPPHATHPDTRYKIRIWSVEDSTECTPRNLLDSRELYRYMQGS